MSYVYEEYPKWVHPKGEEPRVVQSRDEEERALGVAEDPGGGISPRGFNALTAAAETAERPLEEASMQRRRARAVRPDVH